MSKRKTTKITPKEDAQSIGYFALFGGGFVAYLSAEAVLAARPHPWHWLVGGTGAVVAGALGYGLTYWRRTHRS